MRVLARLTRQREFIVFVIVIILVIGMSIASPIFLTVKNLLALMLGLSTEQHNSYRNGDAYGKRRI